MTRAAQRVCGVAIAAFCAAARVSAAGRDVTSVDNVVYTANWPAIASNGHGFLAAWTTDAPLYGAHVMPVDENGRPAAPAAKPIDTLSSFSPVDITSFGDAYVVARSDGANGVRLTVVTPAGDAVQAFTAPVGWVSDLSVESTGNGLMLAGRSFIGERCGLFAFFLDQHGGIVSMMRVSSDANVPFSTTTSGGDFVIATGGLDGAIQKFDSFGTRRGEPVRLFEFLGLTTIITVASDGESVVVAGASGRVAALLVIDRQGTVTRLPHVVTGTRSIARPKLHFRSDQFVMVYLDHENPGTNAKIVAVTFALDDQKPPAVSVLRDDAEQHRLYDAATNGTSVVAVSLIGDYPSVVGATAFRDADAQTIRGDVLSLRPAAQDQPHVAADGFGSLAVWAESLAPLDIRIRATRLSVDGTPAGETLTLTPNGISRSPAVAYGAGVYLVVWVSSSRLIAKRITSSGVAIDEQPLDLRDLSKAGGPADPAVAWNGRTFVVTWTETNRVHVATVSPAGVVTPPRRISPPPTINNWMIMHQHPLIASTTSGRSVVLYQSARIPQTTSLPVTPEDVHVEAIAVDTYAFPAGPPLRIASGLTGRMQRYAIAGGRNSDFLVAIGDADQLVAIVLDAVPNLTIEKQFRIFQWLPGMIRPAVAWNGSQYVVAWRYAVTETGAPGYVAMAHVTAAGAVGPIDVAKIEIDQPAQVLDLPDVSLVSSTQPLVLTAELHADASTRIRSYSSADLTPIAARPSPPTLVSYTRPATNDLPATIAWNAGGGEIDGYAVESVYDFSRWITTTVPATERSVSLRTGAQAIAVRAWNSGGFSESSSAVTATVTERPDRRRATRH